jgi:hypothetical protein
MTHADGANGWDLVQRDPWIAIWIGHVAITGSMVRGSYRIDGRKPGPDGNALDRLFILEGPPPSEVKSLVLRYSDAVADMAHNLPARVQAGIRLWRERHRRELALVDESLSHFYAAHVERLRRECQDFRPIGEFTPGSVFEAAFAEWILTARPAVLERAVELAGGLFFTAPSEPAVRHWFNDFIRDLRQLNDVAAALAGQLDALKRAMSSVNVSEAEDLFRLTGLGKALRNILAILAPLTKDLKARGRRPDPWRTIAVQCFRAAGLRDGDISKILDVKRDAVRKQARRSSGDANPRRGKKE